MVPAVAGRRAVCLASPALAGRACRANTMSREPHHLPFEHKKFVAREVPKKGNHGRGNFCEIEPGVR